MKILQIDGVKGLISAIFIGVCLFAGFVVFPGYVAMALWNKYLLTMYMFPRLDLFQGVLLWGILAISYCILNKGGFAVSFKSTPELSDDELNSIIRSAKINTQMRMMNRAISKTDKYEINKQNPFVEPDKIQTSDKEKQNEDKISNIK